jgi:signal transduction histidine kinase
LLRQAVDNLIDNAIKYSPPDSAIDICCRQTDSHVHLSVQDHGTGIEPREQECIFDPFYRSPTARQRGVSGLGLGLALVARIVRALGGQITCSSQLDHGARFDMAFPIDSIRSTPSPLRVAN